MSKGDFISPVVVPVVVDIMSPDRLVQTLAAPAFGSPQLQSIDPSSFCTQQEVTKVPPADVLEQRALADNIADIAVPVDVGDIEPVPAVLSVNLYGFPRLDRNARFGLFVPFPNIHMKRLYAAFIAKNHGFSPSAILTDAEIRNKKLFNGVPIR